MRRTHNANAKPIATWAKGLIAGVMVLALFVPAHASARTKKNTLLWKVQKITKNSLEIELRARVYRANTKVWCKVRRINVVRGPRNLGNIYRKSYKNKQSFVLLRKFKQLNPGMIYQVTVYLSNKYGTRRHSRRIQTKGKPRGVVAIAYSDKHYKGRKLRLVMGQNYSRLSKLRMNDKISSIKVYYKGVKIYLYQHKSYRGKKIKLTRSTSRLSSLKWNDKASSIKVR